MTVSHSSDNIEEGRKERKRREGKGDVDVERDKDLIYKPKKCKFDCKLTSSEIDNSKKSGSNMTDKKKNGIKGLPSYCLN